MPWSRAIFGIIHPEGLRNSPEFRKRVEWLMLLRLVITTILLATTIFFQLRETGEVFLHPSIPLYILIGTIFLLSIIYALSLPLVPDLWIFSFIQVVVDVVYATILIHFTGGASSVFTILYVFPIVTSGILHLRRGALVTAALASVLFGLLINFEFYNLIPTAEWPWVSPFSKNTPGYLLLVLVVHFTFFFLLAILSSSLAEQLQKTKISLNLTETHFKTLAELHNSIVKSIPSGIITTDETDRIIYINTPGEMLLGVPSEDIKGSALQTIFPVMAAPVGSLPSRKERFLSNKEANGELRSFELSVSALQGKDELPRGKLVIFQDVTKMRNMEERIKLSEKQAAFVRIAAGMAHEIRNPLAALRGATELLSQEGPRDPHIDQRLCSIVLRESDRLNALLGDFLLTVGGQSHITTKVNLTELIQDTITLFSQDTKLVGKIRLETMLDEGVEIEGDPSRLKQALWNLLKNASEADSEKGLIRIFLRSEINSAIVQIQDFGLGIEPAMRERIFEPFTTTKEKGTGLGLSVVLSVIEAHDGALELDSVPGSGTIFTIRFPLAMMDDGSQE